MRSLLTVRPIWTAERAMGSERKRSITLALRVLADGQAVDEGTEDGGLHHDPGHEEVDVADVAGVDGAAEHVTETAARRSPTPSARPTRRGRRSVSRSCRTTITRLSASVSANDRRRRWAARAPKFRRDVEGGGRHAFSISRASSAGSSSARRPVSVRNTSSRLGCCSSTAAMVRRWASRRRFGRPTRRSAP